MSFGTSSPTTARVRDTALPRFVPSMATADSGGAFPGRNGVVTFSSQRQDRGWELYSVNPRGGRARELTAHSPLADRPVWSPDGHTLAFIQTDVGRPPSIFVVDVRTRRPRSTRLVGTDAAWNQDGTRLVYVARNDLWVANRLGQHRRRLISTGCAREPAWSPIGRRIAYVDCSAQDGPERIYLIDSDGRHRRFVRNGADPVWSPNGSNLAFRSRHGVEVADAKTGAVTLVDSTAGSSPPAWSPDSREFVVLGVHYSLSVLAADGSSSRAFPSANCSDRSAVWAPAAMITVATSCWNPDGAGLQAVDPLSGERHWLVMDNSDGGAIDPSWSPDTGKLAFLQAGVLELANADGSPCGGNTHPTGRVRTPPHLVSGRAQAGCQHEEAQPPAEGADPHRLTGVGSRLVA